MIKWKKQATTDYDWFSPSGHNPYRTIHTAIARDEHNVRWDLTVLRSDKGHYLAAHGGIILPEQHSTIKSAKARAENWFNNER